jgi:hypothetical protein
MSLAGHSILLDPTLAFQRLLDVAPYAGTRITHWKQQFGLFRDVLEIADQFAARLAGLKMGLLLSVAASFDDVGQNLLKLLAIHVLSPLSILLPSRSSADGLLGSAEL